MEPIYISVLARCIAPGSTAHMGSLACPSFEVSGEGFLRELVSAPTAVVGILAGDPEWATREARLVAELGAAPDQAARNVIKLRIPALVPARFEGTARNKAECLGRQVIGHDFDHVTADTFEAACESIRAQLPDRFLAIHTTATERNPDGTWRLRAFEILDRPATVDEWDRRVKPLMRSLGEHDEQALDVARLLYMPVRTAGYRFALFEGVRTKVDDLPLVEPKVEATAPRATSAPQSTASALRKAAAGTLGGVWPEDGKRHHAQLALAGGLIHDGWNEPDAIDFLCDVCRIAGDEKRTKREQTVRSTLAAKASGEAYTGWSKLEEHVGSVVVHEVRKLLDGTAAVEARLAAAEAARAMSADGEAPAKASSSDSNPLGFTFGGYDVKPPPTDFLVDGLLPRGCVGMFFGRADSLKTWLLFSLAVAVASGKPWLDRFLTKKAKVGIVDYETGRVNTLRRLFMLRAGDNPNLGTRSFAKLKPNQKEFWEELERYGFELLILDSLRQANPGADENDSFESILPLTLAAEFTERTGCTIVWIHHANRASGDGWPDFRGSSAIEAEADPIFAVKRTEGQIGDRRTVEIRCDKGGDMRAPEPFTVEIVFDDVAFTAAVRRIENVPEVPEESTEEQMRAMALEILRKPEHSNGIKKNVLRALLKGKQDKRVRVMAALESDGVVTEYREQRTVWVRLNPHVAA